MVEIFDIKRVDENHISEIVNLWNENLPKEFAVTDNLIRNKIFEDGDLYKEGSFELIVDDKVKGIIISKINNSKLEEYENCAWISVLLVDRDIQNSGFGEKLLDRTEEALINLGIKKIILAGDFNNFFSGIPDPKPEKISFFQNRKYTINHENHFDLMADVSKLNFDEMNIKMNHSEDFSTVEYKEEYFDMLMRFFDRSFPGRWKFEIVNYLETGGELKNILVMLHGDRIVGFCKVFKSEDTTDNTIVYGQNHGSLGPIGISEEFRGKGVGNRILSDSFKMLKVRGTENVLIDWTILKDFYGQFGFVPLRTYRGAYKVI